MKKLGIGMIILLVIQYILGMATNLFVKFPDTTNQGQLWEFAWKQIPVALHILVGFSLIIVGAALIMKAVKEKNKNWKMASILGFIFIFTAAFSGSRFIPTQNDIYSFIMSLSFLAALLSYGWGIRNG